MKSVAIKGIKEFEIKEMEEPTIDNENVIIDIKKTGICGSDIHNWEMGAPIGLVLGHEFCGVVKHPGSREDLKVGDRVTALPISPCNECYACKSGNPQYCRSTWVKAVGLSLENPGGLTKTIKVRSDMVIPVPDEMTDEEVAMVEPTAVSLHAINLANIKENDKVLVIGGGIIGLSSAMLAKTKTKGIVAVSEANINRGKKAVALEVVDKYYDARSEKLLEEIMIDTKDGYDVVIECCGNAPAVTSAIMAVKPGGTIVLVGVSPQPITIPTVLTVMNEVRMQGAIAYTKEEFKETIELIKNKKINVLKFVDEIVGLDDVQKSYEKLTNGESEVIKILVDPNK